MKTEPELIPTGKSWLTRTTAEAGKVKDQIVVGRKFKHELVYGEWEPIQNKDGHVTGHRIVGKAYHSLTGDIGLRSIEAMADAYNKAGKVPDAEAAKTRMDGFKQSFEQGGGNALFDAATLQKCISFAPEK